MALRRNTSTACAISPISSRRSACATGVSSSPVLSEAMRALSAITVLAAKDPDLRIRISATWFVEMLNSVEWSDRHKAVMALLDLTDSRPESILNLIRERAMPSLAEMARWKSLTHAIGPYTLLGRAAGLTEKQIQDSWSSGGREPVIAKALKLPRKSAP